MREREGRSEKYRLDAVGQTTHPRHLANAVLTLSDQTVATAVSTIDYLMVHNNLVASRTQGKASVDSRLRPRYFRSLSLA